MVTITFSCCFTCYLKGWWHHATFLTFIIFNFHSYNTIILSFILHHSLRPPSCTLLSPARETSMECRAEIRTRACLTKPTHCQRNYFAPRELPPHPISYAAPQATPHPKLGRTPSYAAPQATPHPS
jgi:hypothetical protein